MPNLTQNAIHLGPAGKTIVEPPFTGPDWYTGYEERHGADGIEGRLVSQHEFTESWADWEMHPEGAEVVLCISDRLTLVQEDGEGRIERVALSAGDYAINPPGVWHTADVEPGRCPVCVFITIGAGTRHRPR